jgi:hypothetical protein
MSGLSKGTTGAGKGSGLWGPAALAAEQQLLRERDEARAEAERLRGVLREIHTLATTGHSDRVSGVASAAINLYGEHLRDVLNEIRGDVR